MSIDPGKYTVFNTAEFDRWWMHNVRPRLEGTIDDPPTTLDDAVVIRKQDMFAGPGLSAYAAAIQTALDVAMLSEEQEAHLEELRDFFHEQAQEAFGNELKKVPD